VLLAAVLGLRWFRDHGISRATAYGTWTRSSAGPGGPSAGPAQSPWKRAKDQDLSHVILVKQLAFCRATQQQ